MLTHRCLLATVAAVLFACAATAQERPNIVFFLVDDLGWTDVGYNGSTFYETPNIDRVAARGMKFTNAYAACPVCSPTRASILAGKYPARMHTTAYFGDRRRARLIPPEYVNRLPLRETTLAEALRAGGYRTGFVGKWHLGGVGFGPEQQGFDVNVGGWARGAPRGGYFSPYENPALSDGPDGEFLTKRLTDEAIRFVEGARDRPFLLYFSYYTVHTPLQAPKELVARYRAKAARLPERKKWGSEPPRAVRLYQDHAVYAAMVESLDTSVGRVLRTLDRLGLRDRTVIVFMSDNGGLSTSEGFPTSNLPLRAGKGWLYEGGIREPMFIVWPGVTAPDSWCATPVTSTDFYPTLLEVAGLPARPEQHVDGISLAPALRGGTVPPDRPLFWHHPHYGNQGDRPGGAVRRGRWKLVEHYEDMSVELFDLAADIGETDDLSRRRPELTRELRGLLHAWRRDLGARMPRPNPGFDPRRWDRWHRRANGPRLGGG